MRVLVTLPVKIGFDGMTKQILSFVKYMDRTDLEVDLVSGRGLDPKMTQQLSDANFDHIYRMEYRDKNQLHYFINLCRLMRKQKYDVIHVNGQSATMAIELLAAKITKCPVRIAHSHGSMCKHTKLHRLLLPLFRITCNDAIACSKEAGDWLFGKKMPYWILNNGINVQDFIFDKEARKCERERLGLSEELAIGHVGAFEPWKNHEFLLNIITQLLKKNMNIKLFLIGIDGSTKEMILKKIKELNLQNNVIYLGTTDNMPEFLQAMDLMLLPSWYEGFPVTVVEWQANGLPCIISNTISNKAKVTDLVKYLPIDNGIDIWVNTIMQYRSWEHDRSDTSYPDTIRSAGYDIKKNAKELKEHYQNTLRNLQGEW